MYQQQRIISSDYQIVDEDEYAVILAYATTGNINIYLPYATNFDKVIILKADNSLNEVFVHLKGNDTFQGSKSPYRLRNPYQLVEFTTDNESAWYAISTYSSGSASSVGGSGGVSVHSDLSGLLVNDHPQYLHVSGSNPMASNLDMRGFSIYDVLNINDVNILTLTSSIDGHILDTNNPHATTFSKLDPGTLSELNSVLIDANLDDSGSARTPLPHSASHLSGGSDPININQLGASGIPEGHTFAVGSNGNIVTILSSSLGIADHGNLQGLGDLDHPQYETTASFRPFSESVKIFTSSVSVFSSSYSSRISALEAQSASITSSLETLFGASSSFRSAIGDLQTASSSFSERITSLESASGTFVSQITELFVASSSYSGFSASFVGYSASWSAMSGGGSTDISALNSFSSSVQLFTSSIQSQTASVQAFSASILAASASWSDVSQSYYGFSASHASRHLSGGAYPIDAQNLRADSIPVNHLLISNANGGWTTVASSSVGGGGSTDISALNSHSASVQEFSASILAASASFETELTSQAASIIRLDNASASYAAFSASFVGYSASWSAISTTDISSLNSFSASILEASSSWTGVSQSYYAFSASHASRHLSGGADPIDAQSLRGNGLAVNRLLITDGNGGWTTVASSSVGGSGGGGGGGPTVLFSDTSISQSIATLPANPSQGERVIIGDSGFNAGTNAIIITGSHNILSEQNDHILTDGGTANLIYNGSIWLIEGRSTGNNPWRGIYDSSSTNHYSGAAGILRGPSSASFWVEALFISPPNFVDGHVIFGNYGSNTGWVFQISFGNLSFATFDSGNNLRDSFVIINEKVAKMTHMIGVVNHIGSFYEYQLYINGNQASGGDTFSAGTTYSPSDASNRPYFGSNDNSAYFANGTILGGSYSEGSITQDQILTRYKELTQAGRVVAGEMNPDHRYDARDVIDAGATWIDVGASASAGFNFARTGTPSYRRGYFR